MLAFQRILCPTDFSEVSLETLNWASELAARCDAELHLLHVVAPLDTALGIVTVEELNREPCAEALCHLLAILRERVLPTVRVRALVRLGDAATEITKAATQEKADLIVIATHGRSGWRHMAMGSVAESVVRSASCPVITLTVKQSEIAHEKKHGHFPIKRILCPVDFSPASAETLRQAGALAAHFRAQLLVLHVSPFLEAPFVFPYSPDLMPPLLEVDAQDKLQKLVDRLVPGGADCLIERGEAAEEILRVAANKKADLIVIATHGTTGWRHLVFGSVTEQIVRRAICPVFTIRSHAGENAPDLSPDTLPEPELEPSPQTFPPLIETSINPWRITDVPFPARRPDADKLRFLLNYAILAPSGHNTQPWLFKVRDNCVELYADKSRALPVIDPGNRELIMSCGAALFNLRLALRHFGYRYSIDIFPDAASPDLLARLQLDGPLDGKELDDKKAASAEEDLLFEAIALRHTNRQTFAERGVPDSALLALHDAACKEGAWLCVIKGGVARDLVSDLIKRGDCLQSMDTEFRRELESCIRPERSSGREGIPGYALGNGGVEAYVTPLTKTASGAQMVAQDRQIDDGLPMLVVLGTTANSPRDWLNAGQALQRLLLQARSHDIWASFLNHPMEVAGLWPDLQSIIQRRDFPQFLLRMGYAADANLPQPTPRRTVDEVLLV